MDIVIVCVLRVDKSVCTNYSDLCKVINIITHTKQASSRSPVLAAVMQAPLPQKLIVSKERCLSCNNHKFENV